MTGRSNRSVIGTSPFDHLPRQQQHYLADTMTGEATNPPAWPRG